MSRTYKDAPSRRKSIIRRYYASPPRLFINHVWTSRQRQAVRVACLEAVKEHRATWTVDVIPSVDQHRQCAKWLWS
ncbi:MAG TPA: hypothetical protein VE465_11965 [Streptosporangiaceae bacterium]|jgi:hypothetical protein|nr:hypothetical protein [Streptosporangiaceae bacterium]